MKNRENKFYVHAEQLVAEREWNENRYESLMKKMSTSGLTDEEKDMANYYRQKLNIIRSQIGKAFAPASL